MQINETQKILLVITDFYPNLFKMSPASITLWHRVIGDMDFCLTQSGLVDWVKKNKYPPTPADLREYVDYRSGAKRSPEQAFELAKVIAREGRSDWKKIRNLMEENKVTADNTFRLLFRAFHQQLLDLTAPYSTHRQGLTTLQAQQLRTSFLESYKRSEKLPLEKEVQQLENMDKKLLEIH